jgi:hypothetical protein
MNKLGRIAQGELSCGRTKRHAAEVGEDRPAFAPEWHLDEWLGHTKLPKPGTRPFNLGELQSVPSG